MAGEQRLDLRHTQHLALTLSLQQSLKILQLPVIELKEYIDEELEKNPMLEMTDKEETVPLKEDEDPFDIDKWTEYFQGNATGGNYETEKKEDINYENLVKNKITLEEHLLWQLQLSTLSKEDFAIGEAIIGNLNEDGYLTLPVLEIAEKLKVPVGKAEKVLLLIKTFEPAGVGARNLQECLIIQLKAKNQNDGIVWKIVSELWDDFEKGRFDVISGKLNVDIKEIYKAVVIISKLEPKPGREISNQDVRYIIPDVRVERFENGKYNILINNEGIPHLKINNFYNKRISEKGASAEEKNFMKEKLKSALWLIKAIQQRKKTLFKVTSAIIEEQKEFIEKGIEYLRPLKLKEISAKINMHESTVSRVTTNKYMLTPRGIFSFKYFFNVKLNNNEREEGVSSKSVKDIIKNIVEEDKENKLSDSKIEKTLLEKGINISRRTIAKYREELDIPPVSKRKVISHLKGG